MSGPAAYDSRADTLFHARDVGRLMSAPIKELVDRAQNHDDSKTRDPERPVFDEFTPKLEGVEYGSPKYLANLSAMGSGLAHHYANNPHHPEHYGRRGVRGMTLIDLIEMMADWKARCDQRDGSLARSLEFNKGRFNIPPGLYDVLVNTARHYGWIEPDDLVDEPRPTEDVEPGRLIEAMTANGWTEVGRRSGTYVRLGWPEAARPGSLRVWLDPTAPEYEEMKAATLRELRAAADLGKRAQAVLDEVARADAG